MTVRTMEARLPLGQVGTSVNGAEMLPLLYRSEERYGWSVGMRAITQSLLSGCDLPDGPIIDLGCGGGRMLSELRTIYPDRRLYGVDLSQHALAYVSRGAESGVSFTRSHLHESPFMNGTFALCLALDAYDQRGVDLHLALAESRRILRADGVLLLRVSAHCWLYGPHDAAFNTRQRYAAPEMLAALWRAGYAAQRVTFANTLLSVPEGAIRLLQRWHVLPFLPSLYTTQELNMLLATALEYEARWLQSRNLPGGMSLYVIARKVSDRPPEN